MGSGNFKVLFELDYSIDYHDNSGVEDWYHYAGRLVGVDHTESIILY